MIKKIIKSKIFIFILGILCSAITAYAVTYFPSNQVTYDNSTSKLNSTNVQGAIDELYNTCSKTITFGNYIYFLVESDYQWSMVYSLNLENSELKEIFNSYNTEIERYTIKDFYITSDYIYLMVQDTWPVIYRLRLDGSELKEIFNGYNTEIERYTIKDFYVTSDYIYLMVQDTWSVIYRLRLDGSELKEIFNRYNTVIEQSIIKDFFVK